jgi:Uma2 family endonuclease
MTAIIIPDGFKVTSRQFDELAESNTDVRMELTAQGELITMPPTGGNAGKCNFNLYLDLGSWNRSTGLGVAFDSSTIFILPNGARRSPDVAWVTLEKWQSLTPEEQDGFPPLVPDFVIELVSPSDLKKQKYQDLQGKMQEYLDNGVRLGWLIEPKARKVEVYRQGQSVDILLNPKSLSGEDVLPNFVLNLDPIWS